PPPVADVALEGQRAGEAEVEGPAVHAVDDHPEETPANVLPLAVWRPAVQFLSTSEADDTSAADSDSISPHEHPPFPPAPAVAEARIEVVATVQEVSPDPGTV